MSGPPPAILITHPEYQRHQTSPSHPERPERLQAIEAHLRRTPLWEACPQRAPEPADPDILAGIHTRAYIATVRRIAGEGGGYLDPDTPVSAASYDVARRAVGGARLAVDVVLAGEAPVALALLRPPGHHAGRDAGRGFCVFNNAAFAAHHALERSGRERVVILDWDVHHGNGTQEVFYRDPGVVYCSLHQEHWYPGTGFLEEVGEGPGEGATINIPLPAGLGDGGYTHLFEEVVLPLLRAAAPSLVVISAGFDAHHADPLGGMLLTAQGFASLARLVRTTARETPIAAVLEGGYDLEGLASSVVATLEGLTGIAAGIAEPRPTLREAPFAVASARAREARRVLGQYWTL